MQKVRVKLRTKPKYYFIVPLLLAALAPNAWAEESLDAYVARIKQRPAGKIEPFPSFKIPAPHTYQSQEQRNPFRSSSSGQFKPNLERAKQPLEGFALDALRMVGSLKRDKNRWALVATPDNKIHPIKIGDYVGLNYGKVVEINNKEIKIIETVNTHAGWEKRPASLVISNEES
jgi:type IV pilus assembly protein PilP